MIWLTEGWTMDEWKDERMKGWKNKRMNQQGFGTHFWSFVLFSLDYYNWKDEWKDELKIRVSQCTTWECFQS